MICSTLVVGGVHAAAHSLLLAALFAVPNDRPAAAEAAPCLPAGLGALPALAVGEPRVHFDDAEGGALWARGERWKMRFDEQGAVYHASFGPHLPGAVLPLSPARATLGGEPLALDASPAVRRLGGRVELDRGAFVEAYALAPDSVEQLFVLDSLPRAGELTIHIPLAQPFAAVAGPEGIRIPREHGELTYSRAVAIDAKGRPFDAPTDLDAEGIVIRVAAEDLAAASLPLVIDPYVNQTWLDTTGTDAREPDAAWDSFNKSWVVVYQEAFSATDNDVRARVLLADGTLLFDGYVDLSSENWSRPRIAFKREGWRCLAVAEVGPLGSRRVWGRTLQPNGVSIQFGTKVPISPLGGGEASAPTVGGDPSFFSTSAFFCVAWQQANPGSAVTHQIVYTLLDEAGGIVLGNVVLPPGGGLGDTRPALSKSNGTSGWTLAYQRSSPVSFGDIQGAYIRWDGALTATFGITAGGLGRDAAPAASSPLSADAGRSAVAFERRGVAGGQADVWVAILDDGAVVETANISALEQTGNQGLDQINPSIDSDGLHFFLAYSEYVPAFLYYELKGSDLHLSGDTLGVSQGYQDLFPLGLSQLAPRVTAAPFSSVGPNRFLIANHVRQNDQDYDLSVVRWDSVPGGSWAPYCFGDGTGGPCPCGNTGAPGHGCANSADAAGGRLSVTGLPSLLIDSAVLLATNLTTSQPCLFFQGTTELAGLPFGEGLRCAGGSVVRLGLKTASGGSASFPGPGDPPLTTAGSVAGGSTVHYQVWYRDPSSFCNGSNQNLTNGVRILWAY